MTRPTVLSFKVVFDMCSSVRIHTSGVGNMKLRGVVQRQIIQIICFDAEIFMLVQSTVL